MGKRNSFILFMIFALWIVGLVAATNTQPTKPPVRGPEPLESVDSRLSVANAQSQVSIIYSNRTPWSEPTVLIYHVNGVCLFVIGATNSIATSPVPCPWEVKK